MLKGFFFFSVGLPVANAPDVPQPAIIQSHIKTQPTRGNTNPPENHDRKYI
jgi:hypothetical protein